MRWRGVHHVEFFVLDYEASVAFYDQMFGWLGYKSFWTLDIGYLSTYYVARFPFAHSYIGLQPAQTGSQLHHSERATGIHHIALWAKNRKEVDAFYQEFLIPNNIPVTDAPAEYFVYAPGYYATFFDDPINGIHWELAATPLLPSPRSYYRWWRALKEAAQSHPQWKNSPIKEAMRPLPGKLTKPERDLQK